MKQANIVNAYKTMESLAGVQGLSEQEQWSLYQLRKLLRKHFEFQMERESAIREKYTEFADENGNLANDKAREFLEDMRKIDEMEIELDEFTKPKIHFAKGIPFTTAEALEDFIEFTPN